MDAKPLLDPKNDFVFKRLFADAPDLLAELINAVRSAHPPVQVVEVLNPRIDPEEFLGKYIVLDILAEDEHGRRYNIEMQVRRERAWSERSVYYLAKTFVQPLRAGGEYETLKSAIGIHLLDFELFPDPTQAHWCFEMRDRQQPSVTLGEELQLNLIELPKADRAGLAAGALAAWVAFLEHWQEEDRMAEIDYPPVQQALKRIRRLSEDEEAQHRAMMRERAVHTRASELRGAREDGLAEGLAEGRELGREEGLAEGLQQGLEAGHDNGLLEGKRGMLMTLLEQRFGGLSEQQRDEINAAGLAALDRWTRRLFEATSIEDLLG
jgi:predicted transposase/invertase (TIGR01784 family)